MKVVLEAITTLFETVNDLNTNTGGQLYFTEGDQDGAIFPYVTYQITSNVPDWTFEEDFEIFIIQFSIFSDKKSSIEVLNLFEDLKSLFDDAVLTVVGWTHLFTQRVSGEPVRNQINGVWQQVVDYEILIERERP